MDIETCLSMNGTLVDSCFAKSRSQYQFQCRFKTDSGKTAIMYFEEKKSEKEIKADCRRLRGKLAKLTTFISRKPNLERGRQIYVEKGCAVCHGSTGEGDGPISAALRPKATDFTQGFSYGDDLESIVRSISEGIPDTGMAPYAGILEDYELADVARYVRLFHRKKPAGANRR